ncbi:MAG: DNA polymerase III subunit alpha [Candidatus Zambryskibacteria bacterium RIFOXYD1_FULL_40_13]|nr:MAG: polymerase III, alpha subunit protein [Parcubacteria group bacterium GW2011_GWC1_39_12]KKR19120.1 MAG: polymerase III, alpha subunit protein [Parcubacteria group bacterium GW2011_GWF1_39_37]KKR34963.1 MAG: polymerase III, alpha subunit protein [Parcubacteria group bacterium GW2011_GWC2_40_10]KKR51883.1 MAG: polymerase III, alpha subunit protein [Parcubacteria group bacterium GW2011_GWE1_40_20]KKR69016.1 MAG: polymerase III, alpha subunit protein [Parcubacteria group bacterium GW2011_GWF
MSSKFIHLHTHSHYSLLNALPKINALVDEAIKNEMPAIALTDNCNLYGAIEFYKTCKKKEIKPIIGIDAYVAYRSRLDKTGIDKERYRLVLLAENEVGYKNLIQLVTLAHLEGFYYKPRIDREILEKYHEGLIAIAPSFSSDILKSLQLANDEQALERLNWYKRVFSGTTEKPNFFLEITHHPEIKGHEENMRKMVEFGKNTNTPIVASHDVYYINKEDRVARETLLAVQSQNDEKIEEGDDDFSFITPKQAEKYFKDLPEALENTTKIADRCNLEISIGKWFLPKYVVESGLSYDDELRRITEEGIKKRGLTKTPEIEERMEYELKIIRDKGYAPYFLVVSDLLHFAHENGILTTIRGSVAGSLVTYLSGITNVDPLLYKLPFERFLNPERPSAPDIDMDYADNRRDEMIDYARRKYGIDKVAQIGTFGTMAARGAVRDVTRALGFPYGVGDSIAKLIPMGAQGFPMTIERALKETPELKTMYDSETDVKKIIDMAKKIEGCARHISVHAAGVVISPTPLTDYVPLQYDTKGDNKIITQYDMNDVGEDGVGLLKFDFLGIRNLSILADAVKLTEKLEGIKLDIENVPVDDKKTFEMLARGETIGLFQLNGDGMTRSLMELKPTVIYDINVMVALYRPGPMDNIQEYMQRKHGKKPTTYIHPKMKNFLDRTFGVLVYQDDLMMTAIEVAGYTWGEVDKFRKAIGKKIREEMAKQHVKFVEGCQKHGGMTEKKAEELWNLFEPFQGYGFNKAHAASYGKVAYQTAYMKANFPAIYMSAVLTAESGDVEKIAEIIGECKRMGIAVLPPDVNESFEGFTVIKNQNPEEKDSIRFGLTTIKNFGEGIASSIIAERKAGGKFISLSDFLRRIKDKNLNKKSLEALIKTGAMDFFGDRGLLLSNLEKIIAFNKEERSKESDQDSLFGGIVEMSQANDILLEPAPLAIPSDKLLWEKELLGLYISGHPLESFKNKLETKATNIKKIKDTAKEREEVVVGGIIEDIRSVVTKKGDKMIFLKFADLTDSIEAVAFPKVFEEFQDILIPESCLVIKGTFSTRNGGKSILIDKAKLLE